MFRKLLIGIALFSVSIFSFASTSWGTAKSIYVKLLKKNNLVGANLYLVKDSDINGWVNNKGVHITTGALLHLNQAQISLLLAHELAHWQFRDHTYSVPGKYQEDRADRYGSRWAEKIGYDKCSQAEMFKIFKKKYGDNGGPMDSHSSNSDRYKRLCSK